MTLSIAKALLDVDEEYNDLGKLCIKNMQNIGRHYPFSGYGGNFYQGIFSVFLSFKTYMDLCMKYGSFSVYQSNYNGHKNLYLRI